MGVRNLVSASHALAELLEANKTDSGDTLEGTIAGEYLKAIETAQGAVLALEEIRKLFDRTEWKAETASDSVLDILRGANLRIKDYTRGDRAIGKGKQTVKHGVYIAYGVTSVKMSASDLQLIADALDVVSPDTDKARQRAHVLQCSFLALSEYAETVK